MTSSVTPFSLRTAPALIEKLLPVQKLSSEAYKEQMANQGKTLNALGSYWKGRKPLILAKGCLLGSLLPATSNSKRDLEIFEMLMGMDKESMAVRQKRRPKPKEILATLSVECITEYFSVEPNGILPMSAPVDWSDPRYSNIKVNWRDDVSELDRRGIEAEMLPKVSYRELVEQAQRPEEVMDVIDAHIWDAVNRHIGTDAKSLPELIEQLGIMRFGHRPRMADAFCGSGQIPFEAARLGCDTYASDLNPVACMLTWGAFNIVGASPESRAELKSQQQDLVARVQCEIDQIGIEPCEDGWFPKAFLYCVEVRCPQSGWLVPLIPSLVISTSRRTVAKLVPDSINKRYNIHIVTGVSESEMNAAESGTVGRDGKYGEAFFTHRVDGTDYRTKITTLRGEYQRPDGIVENRLRLWEKQEFMSRPDDLLQERLYCIQWMRRKKKGVSFDYEFRAATPDDLSREHTVEAFMHQNFADWQGKGWIPDMRIEVGGPPRYQGLDLIRARGWTHWHHLFNPRQLFLNGLVNRFSESAGLRFGVCQVTNFNSKLSRWHSGPGVDAVIDTFYNQALNTIYNYGSRSSRNIVNQIATEYKTFPLKTETMIQCIPADQFDTACDVLITDPPYGDAVKYEEILDFVIAWLRRSPPPEFRNWIWDSRRTLAIKGEDENFRRSMVIAYKHMTEKMSADGIQVIMFTHQSGSIWADMANIVWASGLQVTAAWYVVTETDSALREGSYVKGTVLLVLRKRGGMHKTTRDDLAWEIQEEVESQVNSLTGLNQEAKGLYRDESVFEDADIQMAGYAAALRVLTRYAIIDGRDMTLEAVRPRTKGEETFVDGLIKFAVDTANQCLVPQGIAKGHWDGLSGAERFYLKLLDLESKGLKTLDNYQNFAKAFKVHDFRLLMASQKANQARLKNAMEFGKTEMSEGSELHQSVLRAVLYGMMELVKNVDGIEVLTHLSLNVPDYFQNQHQRELAAELAHYLAKKLEALRPEEAGAARILRDLVRNQRLG